MPRAAINGAQIYYESHGQGPAIVFAHGRGGNHMSWWRQVPEFSKEFRCITFDHRGWGASTEPAGGPGRKAFAEDIKQLLDHLKVQQAFLVAQSMGGLGCLGFALANPQRTLGLVLGDTTGGIGDPSVVGLLKDVHPPTEPTRRSLSAGFVQQHPNLAFLYRQIGQLNPEMPINAVSDAFRDPAGPQARDLARMKAPTLLIVGQEDLIFPVHVMQAAQRLIANSRLEIVPGAAHSTHFEQPQVFNRLVKEFFAQVMQGKAVAAAGN
ncbi:MAG: alpha/beta hydrolase [SAR202 cluster bacterium]|nr:alpha/beta hydrolase [SAR202 cluster bacterium]